MKKVIPILLLLALLCGLGGGNFRCGDVLSRGDLYRRTGIPDQRVKTAYHYEFSPGKIPKVVQEGFGESDMSMAEWKTLQMKLVGDEVPMVRCFNHPKSVNLTVGGAGAADPGSWNRYAYVGGDPVNYKDRWGLARDEAEAEEQSLSQAGWQGVSLGQTTLRTETAAITVLARWAIATPSK